jgi:hypothetical protein
VPDFGGRSFGISIKEIVPYQIPKLASGAVIPPNAEFLAVLGDQKQGRNIEAPEGLIRQIIQEELGGIAMQEPQVNIIAEGNTDEIIRFFKFRIDKEGKMRGKNLITGGAY